MSSGIKMAKSLKRLKMSYVSLFYGPAISEHVSVKVTCQFQQKGC